MSEWTIQHDVELSFTPGVRFNELALALVIPRSWPVYWMDETNWFDRCFEILEATAGEILPWELE